ncbi:MAG: hypothetical protein QOF79_2715 [Actinomycetota bacterium]|nr:hypothetical protein [Actinomycetota bacterium]
MAAIVAALATVAVSGCTSSTQPRDGAPAVGQCWKSADSFADSDPSSRIRVRVACWEKHQFETFAVPSLAKAQAESVESALESSATVECTTMFSQAVPELPPSQVLVLSNAFLPSSALWKQGARWVDCELSLIKFGSAVANPQLADLPARARSLREAVLTQVDAFDFCVDDPRGLPADGPRGNGSVYADCTGDPDWSLVKKIGLQDDQSPGGVYPPKDVFQLMMTTYCDDLYGGLDGNTVYHYFPTRQQWENGHRDMECWLTGSAAF